MPIQGSNECKVLKKKSGHYALYITGLILSPTLLVSFQSSLVLVAWFHGLLLTPTIFLSLGIGAIPIDGLHVLWF